MSGSLRNSHTLSLLEAMRWLAASSARLLIQTVRRSSGDMLLRVRQYLKSSSLSVQSLRLP